MPFKALITVLLASHLSAAALAQTEVTTNRSKSIKTQRCETQAEIGTRLAKKRICMSEAEWRELRQRTRTDLDQGVSQRPAYCVPPNC